MKVLLDVDTGVDDALALLLLADAHHRGRVRLIGCGTVAGNVEVAQTTRNTLKILELAHLEIPVAEGAARPLLGPLHTAPYVHGDDGLANSALPAPLREPTGEHAVEQILRLSHLYAGELTLLSFGPLTNLGLAFLRDPALARRLRRVVVMGGTLGAGNVSATAEANVYNDPEAARIVLGSGAPVTLVGLDVTHQTYLEEAEVKPLEWVRGPRASLALHFMRHLMDSYGRLGRAPQCVLHDPLAAGVCIEPDLVQTQSLHVDVETSGELTRGMTVADRRPAPEGATRIDVALEVDAGRFKEDFLRAIIRWAGEAEEPIERLAA